MLKNSVSVFCLLLTGFLIASCQPSNVSHSRPDVRFENAFVVVPPNGGDIAMGGLAASTEHRTIHLVRVDSNIADAVEMHDVTMTNGIMKMRKVDRIAIPRGKPLQLKKGGKHLMLFGINAPLKGGEKLPLQLTVEDSSGDTHLYEIEAEIRAPKMD